MFGVPGHGPGDVNLSSCFLVWFVVFFHGGKDVGPARGLALTWFRMFMPVGKHRPHGPASLALTGCLIATRGYAVATASMEARKLFRRAIT